MTVALLPVCCVVRLSTMAKLMSNNYVELRIFKKNVEKKNNENCLSGMSVKPTQNYRETGMSWRKPIVQVIPTAYILEFRRFHRMKGIQNVCVFIIYCVLCTWEQKRRSRAEQKHVTEYYCKKCHLFVGQRFKVVVRKYGIGVIIVKRNYSVLGFS